MNEIEILHPRVVDEEPQIIPELEAIEIAGLVSISQGEDVICKDVRNHFVDQALKGIISTIIAGSEPTSAGLWKLWSETGQWKMYIGSDTATATTRATTALTTPIGVAPGTPPNTQSIPDIHDGGADGDWYAKWRGVWNAGTVNGTLGEAALYMRCPDKSVWGWEAGGEYTPAVVLASRLSSADLDFDSFVIDNGNALTIEWKLQFKFS